MGQSLTHVIETAAEDATTITKWLRIVYNSTMGISDSVNVFNVGGDFPNVSGAVALSVPGGGGTQVIYSQNQTFTKTYGAAGAKMFSASLSGVEYWPGTISVPSTWVAIPARSYTPPSAPGQPSLTAITASGATATWTDPLVWGGDDSSDFGIQVDDDPAFGSPSGYTVTDANSRAFTGLSPNTTYYVRVQGSNAAGGGAWSASVAFTTAPNAPSAPTAMAVTRTSDTQLNVTWTPNPTSPAPVTSQSLQRWDNFTNAWASIAVGLAAAVASLTDTTTVANRRYMYRAVGENSAGSTVATASAPMQTTPGAPASIVATKSGANIVVTFAEGHSAGMDATYEVLDSAGGGAFVLLGTVAAGVGLYTHTAPSAAVTHQYQVRTKSTIGATLYSVAVTSNVVQLAVPPNAPTNLAPNGVAFDASVNQVLSWLHSTADSSPQSKFQIRHRVVGAGSWTTVTAVVSPTQQWTLPAGTYANGVQFEWQVCTWGAHATAGPFSASATVTTSTPPTNTISSPTSSVNTSAVTAVWAYFDAQGTPQAAWQAELLNAAGSVIETRAGVGTATSATFTTSVADATGYSVRVRVQDGSGLWSIPATQVFTVAYLLPAPVAVTAVYHPASASVVITLNPAAVVAGVTVAQSSVTVERRIDVEAWAVIARGVAPSATIVDVTPTIHGVNDYKVTVLSALPSSAVMATVSVTTAETRWVFLSGGASFAKVLRVRGDVRHTSGVDEELQQFADRVKPVLMSSTATQDAAAVSGVLDTEASLPSDFHALQKTPGVKLLRAPNGMRMFGKLAGMSTDEDNPRLTPISFTVTESDYLG